MTWQLFNHRIALPCRNFVKDIKKNIIKKAIVANMHELPTSKLTVKKLLIHLLKWIWLWLHQSRWIVWLLKPIHYNHVIVALHFDNMPIYTWYKCWWILGRMVKSTFYLKERTFSMLKILWYFMQFIGLTSNTYCQKGFHFSVCPFTFLVDQRP